MNALLWTLQGVLAAVFAGAGAMKLIQPRPKLATTVGDWVLNVPAAQLKLLGAAEVLAAIGLIVPPLVGVASVLTAVAASALVLVMAGAVILHARRREYPSVAINVALALVAAVVAWGRFGPYTF